MKPVFGVQLYSVRREIAQLGLDEALAAVKAAGFDSVETAGFYGKTVEEMVETVKRHGLNVHSAHIGANAVEENLPYIDALGMKYVYVPGEALDKHGNPENFAMRVEFYKKVTDMLKKRGVGFGYHNHDAEYTGGGDRVQDLLDAVPGMTSELDIFWASFAGRNAVELANKYGDKLSAVHIKELDKRSTTDAHEFPNAVPGEGKSDCAGAIKAAKKLGVNVFILEVEGFPFDFKEYLAKAYAAIKKMYDEA